MRIWSGVDAIDLAREIGAGAMIVIAIGHGARAMAPDRDCGCRNHRHANRASAGRLAQLGGGYLAVGFALICAVALMLKRAPTDLASAAARKLKPPTPFRSEPAIELADPIDGHDAEISPPAVDGKTPRPLGPIPLKVRRIEPRDTSRDKNKNDAKSRNRGGFKLPPLSLLDIPPAEHAQIDEVALERSARVLEQKLADFGVEGRVVEVQPGPVVTMYKFEPGSGIKVSQIVNLADDLSMALQSGFGANPGAGAGRGRSRHRGAESQARDDLSARDSRV